MNMWRNVKMFSMCVEFNDKLLGMRNYNSAFVVGTKNLRSSSYKDHAVTDMHKRAMLLSKKQHRSDITDYAPTAKVLLSLDFDAEAKFDIVYLIAKENLAFNKMGPLCKLEEQHGIDLDQEYKMTVCVLVSWSTLQLSSRKFYCKH